MSHAQGVTPARPRVMVVEDELVVAMLLELQLDHAGFDVVGPFARLDEAVRAAHEPVDAALLDVNLRGEMVFPAARILISRGVPVVFCSGYTALKAIPPEFSGVPQVSKPYQPELLIAALRDALPAMSHGHRASR